MCKQPYSKLPTKEESFSSGEKDDHKGNTSKQTKWKKIRKSAGKVCNFLFGDISKVSCSDVNVKEPVAYSAIYALGGIHW